MALLKRSSASPDPDFSFLSANEGKKLRDLAAKEFARQGISAECRGDHFLESNGKKYGLHNLVATCHGAPEGKSAWPQIIEQHVTAVLAVMSEPDQPHSLEEMRAHAILRLVDVRSLSDMTDRFGYARPWSDDVLELIAFDHPDWVSYLRDEDLEGLDISEIRDVALDNLRQQPVDERSSTEIESGVVIHSVAGLSFYTASRAILLDEELEAFGEHPHGAFFIIPDRHNLLFHVLKDTTFIPALQNLAGVALGAYGENVSPLSPHVYWWHDGVVTQVTKIGEANEYRVEPDEELTEVMNALAEG